MSADASPAPAGSTEQTMTADTVTHSHKSYRRKYRKIMVKFENQMRESTALFKDQQRLIDISQRVAEQNDQLLSLLLELNCHPQIPARLRYDLGDPASVKKTEGHENIHEAALALRSARHKVSKGDLSQAEYEQLEQSLLDTTAFAPKKSYATFLKGNPLERNSSDHSDLSGQMIGGFLSSKLEEQYLHSLDMYCSRQSSNARSHALSNLGTRQPMSHDKQNEREREFQLKNPVSVYNWLRKHQPQVFLQDSEDKAKAGASSRKSKRESLAKTKGEPELYDEDGIAAETSGNKNKRKRDEDPGYRPKGGNVRPAKRRKDDSGRRSKRASMDISAS